jgi:tetratricopeptide (TPR) repeat protein
LPSYFLTKNPIFCRLGLAELELSEGNLDGAREIYNEAVDIYERSRGIARAGTATKRRVKPAQLGDKWINVYKSWSKFEEQYGSYDDANNVYSRNASAFPNDWEGLVRWARFQCKYERHDRARNLFELACNRAGSKDARPYRQYAEFEMAAGNYKNARSILFRGAQSLSESSNGSKQDDQSARLYHAWAIVEWHLENPDRAEILFDHSLRQIDSENGGSEQRAVVLYSIARFLFHARSDYNLAQHCICLALTENLTPAGDTGIWTLWAKVGDKMSNKDLESQCLNQAEELKKEEHANVPFDVNTLAMHRMLRRAPWQHKITTRSESQNNSWYKGISFPSSSAMQGHKTTAQF